MLLAHSNFIKSLDGGGSLKDLQRLRVDGKKINLNSSFLLNKFFFFRESLTYSLYLLCEWGRNLFFPMTHQL